MERFDISSSDKQASRLRLKKHLETSFDFYKSLFEMHPDAIYALDPEGFFLCANAGFERLTGWSEAQYTQMTYRMLIMPDDLERVDRYFAEGLQGRSQEFETSILRRDGRVVHLQVICLPIRIDGEIVGAHGIAKDITEIKQAEQQLLRSEKLSIAGQVAAGLAHEIRNPLTALKGFLQLMAVNKRESEEYLSIMMAELGRIEVILGELLMLAKPQADRFATYDLTLLLDEAISLLNTQAVLYNIEIVVTTASDLPPLFCDPAQIKQVFHNFLKNAIEAMPKGGRVTVDVRQDGPDAVLLRFADTGCGMAKERVAAFGEPFYTTKEKGTGLGSLVSRKIIENHGGELRVQSELNVGTTIEVRLPVR